MRILRNLTFIAFTLLLLSCQKDNPILVDSDSIIGNWKSEEVKFNGVNSNQYADWLNNSIHFSINNDGTYYRNYVHGTWTLQNNQLTLTPNPSFGAAWHYTILNYSVNTITLEIKLTDLEYSGDFPEFANGDIITITEKYVRE